MKYLGYLGTGLMIVGVFCGLNEILFVVTSHYGMPTVIGGLGWTLDHPLLGWWVFQAAATFGGFGLSFLYDPNNETAAAFRTERAKAAALEKMERIGDGARVTVGSELRELAGKHRVAISPPRPAPKINRDESCKKVPA